MHEKLANQIVLIAGNAFTANWALRRMLPQQAVTL
jgi:hypothetical protein